MKTTKITLVLTAFILISALSFSQTIEGRLSIKGFTNGEIKQKTPVALFKAFKDGEYAINFNYKSRDLKPDNIILFDMNTTVKYNGKIIAQTSRKGWPWIPGDMFVPIEAFDAIPAIQKLAARGLPVIVPFKGSYEFIFQFVPSEGQNVKGTISPVSMQFTVK